MRATIRDSPDRSPSSSPFYKRYSAKSSCGFETKTVIIGWASLNSLPAFDFIKRSIGTCVEYVVPNRVAPLRPAWFSRQLSLEKDKACISLTSIKLQAMEIYPLHFFLIEAKKSLMLQKYNKKKTVISMRTFSRQYKVFSHLIKPNTSREWFFGTKKREKIE